MRGNYRYEEERYGSRGMTPRGFGERGRDREWDEDELERGRGRFASGPDYSREWDRGRSSYDDDYQGYRGSYGRSLGTRESSPGGYDEYDTPGTGMRGETRFTGRGREGNSWFGRERDRDEGRSWWDRVRDEGRAFFGGDRNEERGGYGRDRNQGRPFGGRRDEAQADGWSGEPDEMRWGRQQGLYGSSEYGGYLSSQRMQQGSQSHIGKGPKGWQRSDERIREEVSEALARHPEIDASDVEVRVQNCEVMLTGTVTERRAKRLAEEVAERVFGAKDVQNQIRVKQADGHDRMGERDVTRQPNREGRTTVEEAQAQRRPGQATSGFTRTAD